MRLQTYHPFEILVSRSLFDIDSAEIMVNAGIVYNYYNPGNFRDVKFDAGGDRLEPMPFSPRVVNGKKINYENITLRLDETVTRVVIYLVASFLPPLKWVPSAYFSPKIDEAWLMFRTFQTENDQSSFSIHGTTKNPKKEHIKYEVFDVNNFEIPEHVDGNTFYESTPNWLGNAFNLGIIGVAEKNDSTWTVKQCIKDNFPITFFLNTAMYQTANTDIFSGNVYEEIDEETLLEKRNKIERSNLLRNMPISVHEYRGNIQNYAVIDLTNNTRQLKFPMIYSSYKEGVLPAYTSPI